MLAALVFVGLVACAQASVVTYEGYKVYEVKAQNADQLYLLSLLRNQPEFDFWTLSRKENVASVVMVNPAKDSFFANLVKDNGFSYKVLISDVSRTVGDQLRTSSTPTRLGKISFTKYNRYEEVSAYLAQLAKDHSDIVTLFNIGNSYEGRPIYGIKISTGGSGKPSIFVDGGIHAREWMAPATTLYIIQKLVEDPEGAKYIANIDWHIIPLFNVDGYEYTHTSDRFWRKTRSKGKICKGTDANRNYDWHWMEAGASSLECTEIYAGRTAFSEPETMNFRDYVNQIKDEANMKLYLTFHSYGQYLLYPWGYDENAHADNEQELFDLGTKVAEAIYNVDGTEYTVGSSAGTLYAAAGGSDDWMKGAAGVELAYTIELPGGGSQGFDPPASMIKPVVSETWEGVKVFIDYVENKYAAH